MRTLDTYIGIEPFTVKVDDSSQLQKLARQARELGTLPFPERLSAVKKLTLDAMVNAYEQMIVFGQKADELEGVTTICEDGKVDNSEYETARKQHEKFRDIVFQGHPLSYALEQGAGCCRYQGALFFVLGYEADLGDQHFVQAAPVNSRANTVFNEVVHNGEHHKVSIFTESLNDKSLDYSRQNPRIFEQAFESRQGYNFYSYHRMPSGLVIVENPNQHVKIFGK
jgi:hypothetical protein